MRRIWLVLSLLVAFSGTAWAEFFDEQDVDGWSVKAYRDPTGRFEGCIATNARQRVSLSFYVGRSPASLMLTSPEWDLPSGQVLPATIALDDAPPARASADIKSGVVSIDLTQVEELLPQLKSGRQIDVGLPNGNYRFDLAGIRPALAAATACNARWSKGTPEAIGPGPRTPEFLETTRVDDWDITAHGDPETRALTGCTAIGSRHNREDVGDTTKIVMLGFVIDVDSRASLSLFNPSWDLANGGTMPLRYRVDDGPRIESEGRMQAGQIITIPLRRGSEDLTALRRGRILIVSTQSGAAITFDLSGSARVLDALAACRKKWGGASSAAGVDAEVASDSKTIRGTLQTGVSMEGIEAVKNLMMFSWIPDANLMDLDQVADASQNYIAGWTNGRVQGGLLAFPKAASDAVGDVFADIMQTVRTQCGGKFAFSTPTDQIEPPVIGRLATTCDASGGKTERRFIAYPRDKGGLYVLETLAANPATPIAQIDDADLRLLEQLGRQHRIDHPAPEPLDPEETARGLDVSTRGAQAAGGASREAERIARMIFSNGLEKLVPLPDGKNGLPQFDAAYLLNDRLFALAVLPDLPPDQASKQISALTDQLKAQCKAEAALAEMHGEYGAPLSARSAVICKGPAHWTEAHLALLDRWQGGSYLIVVIGSDRDSQVNGVKSDAAGVLYRATTYKGIILPPSEQ